MSYVIVLFNISTCLSCLMGDTPIFGWVYPIPIYIHSMTHLILPSYSEIHHGHQ